MKEALVLIHYGACMTPANSQFYQQLEQQIARLYPTKQVLTCFSSSALLSHFETYAATSDWVFYPSPRALQPLLPLYRQIHCLPSFLTAGHCWQQLTDILGRYQQIHSQFYYQQPLLERNPALLASVLAYYLKRRLSLPPEQSIIWVGHGGNALNRQSYNQWLSFIYPYYPNSRLILLHEDSEEDFFNTYAGQPVHVIPLQFYASSSSQEKLEQKLLGPLRQHNASVSLVCSYLAELKKVIGFWAI